MLQHILKSKTMMFALALAVFGVVEMNVGVFAQYMTQNTFGLFAISISMAVAILRVVTNLPLDKK